MRDRLRSAIGAAAIVTVVLTGCAAGEHYPAGTARQLQSGVQQVAASAATQDYAGALAELDALQARGDAARKAGTLDQARYLSISRSIAVVRSDLTALQAAAEQQRLQEQLQQLQQQQDEKQKGPGKKEPGKP